jgi:chromosome segregation ATPase
MPDFFSRSRPSLAAVALVVLLAATTGCRTTYPMPTGEIATARSAVASAEDAGAAEQAPLDLRTARQKMQQAQEALDRGDHLRARILSEQAAVDARLAEVTTRADRQQEAVDALRASVRSLREEIERTRQATPVPAP